MQRKGLGFSNIGYKEILPGIADGLELLAGRMMEMSQEIVPVDTGTLKASASIEEPEVSGSFVEVTLGYAIGANGEAINPKTGMPVNSYAVDVHEILDTAHAPPTRAKFLEDPVFEDADQLGDYVTIAVQERIG